MIKLRLSKCSVPSRSLEDIQIRSCSLNLEPNVPINMILWSWFIINYKEKEKAL